MDNQLVNNQQPDKQPETIPCPQTLASSLPTRRNNPDLKRKIDDMRIVLCPIRRLPDGEIHPSLPRTVLKYWLLTEDEIDSIAHFYHQTDRSNEWFNQYPGQMNWDNQWLRRPDGTESPRELKQLPTNEERLSMKRRRVGKFIGLRGCQTPNYEVTKRFDWLEGRLERSIEREREELCRKGLWYFVSLSAFLSFVHLHTDKLRLCTNSYSSKRNMIFDPGSISTNFW